MTVKERFRPEISLGAIIQIIVLVVGMSASWVVMDSRSKQNTTSVEALQRKIDVQSLKLEALPHEVRAEFDPKTVRLEERVRGLENSAARSDERFTNVINLLSRLDARLERIEGALRQ